MVKVQLHRAAFLLSVIVCGVMFAQCNRKTTEVIAEDYSFKFELSTPFALGVTDKACNLDQNICIVMDSVYDDSRCPEGVNCIWEGNAKMRFKFTTSKNSYVLYLDTQPTSNIYHNDTIVGGYHISLNQLSPYPVEDNPIKLSDYAAEIQISAVN